MQRQTRNKSEQKRAVFASEKSTTLSSNSSIILCVLALIPRKPKGNDKLLCYKRTPWRGCLNTVLGLHEQESSCQISHKRPCQPFFSSQHAHMASSSHGIHTGYDFSRPSEGGEEDREWLQLGLGICRKQENNMEQSKYTVPAVSSSLLHFQARQQIGHSLGLELGLGVVGLGDNGGVRRDKDVAPISDYHHKSSLCQHSQGQEDHDYNLDLTARLSSPSWPLHMVSSGTPGSFLGWKMQVSNASHNCSSLPPPPLFSPTTTRPHLVGLWFTLSSTINRDENVTVFMVKKYLVRKLSLSNEDEIEISCMGQKLTRAQTLQQVRDAIWLPGLVDSVNAAAMTLETSLINGSILHQLMSLQYHVPCGV